MTKTKLKITGMSHPRCVKTIAAVSITLKSVQHMKVQLHKVESLPLSFISGILIAFFSIAGCSDMPYTGSMMTTDDIDQYIVSPNEELVCLQNGTDSACLTLIPKESKKADSVNGPIIHIHPEKLVYIFYHEDKEIVRAEKIMDTTKIVETLTETSEDPAPQTGDPSGDIVIHEADDTQQPVPPPPQDPPSDDTQQSVPPPPPPQDPPSDDTQQPSTPPPPQDPPSDSTPPPPQDPPSDSTPPPQTTNLAIGSNNQNNSGDDEPKPTISHRTPDTIYNDSLGGWYVTIYYPKNYIGPREQNNFGFTISSSNGTIGTKELRSNGVRTLITTNAQNLSVQVKWTDDAAHWNGDRPPTYHLLLAPPSGAHRIRIVME